MAKVIFEASKEDRAIIRKIIARARARLLLTDSYTPLFLEMDLVGTHSNGCPLDFGKLLEAKDFDFTHDIAGIARHIDRKTGKLTRCFVPRCAKRKNDGRAHDAFGEVANG